MNSTAKVAVQIATSEEEVPSGADWEAWVRAALGVAGVDAHIAGCVTLRLVGRHEGTYLNEMYRHKQGPTNVLAFAGHGDAEPSAADRELGDLVICLPVVHDEAAAQGKTSLAHLAHLVVHGTLHLAGFDHDDAAAAERMEALETEIVLGLGFSAPYESGDSSRIDDMIKEG